MSQTIRVSMAQLAVAKAPDKIEAQALGSCIGVVLYDPRSKIGGVSHAMLPSFDDVRTGSRKSPSRFVDSSVEMLIDMMAKKGAIPEFIEAKLAGGANMFPDVSMNKSLLIGERNIQAARLSLQQLKIPIVAEDVGETFGRTIVLDTATGRLKVRSVAHGEKEI